MIFNDKEYSTKEELQEDEVFQELWENEKEALLWLFE